MKNKKQMLILSIVIIFVFSLLIIVYYFKDNNKTIIMNEKNTNNNKAISIMLETGLETGVYELSESTSFPSSGYILNTTRSGCENGSTLSYDKVTKEVIIKGNISDKCYIFLDVEPPDLMLNITNLPETYGKSVTVTPTGVTAVYNNKLNQLELSNLTTDIVRVSLTYSNPTGTTPLNTYITSLSGTTQGEGQVVSENGYRYEGENPNNYVMFNNELWRILGVFSTEYDSDNDGTTDATANLVKIIRKDLIGALVWDKIGANDWPNSSLYHLLNEQYYDWNTNKATVGTYCYGYSTAVPAKCDYSIDGIQDGYRNMIVKAKWYLGGGGKTGYTTYTPDSIYSYERDANAIYSGRSASTSGYIGLIYESDYLYGVLASDCARTTVHGSYNSANCAGKDWLYGKGYEWTISPYSNRSTPVWCFDQYGYVGNMDAGNGNGVRPVLYLSSFVYKVSGTGTITDPYIIGM